MRDKAVIVSLSLGRENIRLGRLWFHESRGSGRSSFEYDDTWLNSAEKFALEPALKLTKGAFHTQAGLSLFGAIGDSAPDRWGRMLMRRTQLATDRAKNITPKNLSELDYLLGVNDIARIGALRFSTAPKEELFLAPKTKVSIPPLISLPKLLTATERFIEDEENLEDLKLLLAPGSSLGGARPKATIIDKDGSLAIAKFPRKDDEHNIVLWEAVALTLAKDAKITVPAWRIEYIANKPVLILKRFDRIQDTRIPFLSSMSMLEAKDNEQHSYLEIAYAITQYGAHPEYDLEELWRRIIFTIMIANTDDHLRNHGFIYEQYKGWKLSPAYDLNPTPTHIKPRVLTTAIDFDNTNASLETAMSVANEFRISTSRAKEIIQEVQAAVNNWRTTAKNIGLAKSACDYMESAFDYCKL